MTSTKINKKRNKRLFLVMRGVFFFPLPFFLDRDVEFPQDSNEQTGKFYDKVAGSATTGGTGTTGTTGATGSPGATGGTADQPLICVNPLQNYSVIATNTPLGTTTGGGHVNISGPLFAAVFGTGATNMVVASVSNNGVLGMGVDGSVVGTLTVDNGNADFAGTAPGVTVNPPGTKTENSPVPGLLLPMLSSQIQTLSAYLASLPGVPVTTLTGGQVVFNGAAYVHTAVFYVDASFLHQAVGVSCVITAPTGSSQAVIINVLVPSGFNVNINLVMNNGPLIQAITIWNFLVDSPDTGATITIGENTLFEGSVLYIGSNANLDDLNAGFVAGSIGTAAGLFITSPSHGGNATISFPVSTVCGI
jgi:hypothetical protein